MKRLDKKYQLCAVIDIFKALESGLRLPQQLQKALPHTHTHSLNSSSGIPSIIAVAVAELEAKTEKMEALKRAYADISLNTAKESNARILALELKLLRSQQSQLAAAEKAFATMLRLKSLKDSQIEKAETASLNQVKRIQVLEVQLNEAERTIGSLREELERVNSELKRMRNELVEPLNEQKTDDHATTDNRKHHKSQQNSASNLPPLFAPGNLSTINITCTASGQKNKDSDCCFTGNAAQGESVKQLPAEKEGRSNSDLVSIIMRSKEPELYRNGCTQRIHAFEHSFLTGKVPKEQIDYPLPESKNEANVSENEKLKRPHTVDSAETVKIVTWQAKNSSESEVVQPSSSRGDGYAVKYARRFSRKPRTRCIYMKPTDCFPSHKQDARCHQPSDIECSKTKSGAIPATKSISEEPPHKLLKSHTSPKSSVSSEGAEDKSLSLNRISSNENSGLVPCNKRNVTNQIVVNQNHLNSQNEISQSFPCSTENIEHGGSTEKLTLLSKTEMKDDILLNGTKQNDKLKLLEFGDSKLTPGDQNIAENSDVLDMKDDFPVIRLNAIVETTGDSSESLPQVGKYKFLKYTFQRTRKRGSSSSKNASVLPEKITAKGKFGDKQNVLPEPEEPASATELSRNNRQLMEVARQLISLSEKRW